jgi:hypothetical protein
MLCKTVEQLTRQVETLKSHPLAADVTNVGGHRSDSQVITLPGNDNVRAAIREEVREVEEQNKRKDSVIVRGLIASNAVEFREKFGDVSEVLTGSRIVLDDVYCISRDNKMYRCKILSVDGRKSILEKARELSQHQEFDTIFISRDLTFKQRKQLYERRMRHSARQTGGDSLPPPNAAGGQPVSTSVKDN